MDGFTESGGLGMNVDDMDSTRNRGLGARLRRTVRQPDGPRLLGELRVQVVQLLGDGTPQPSWHPPAYPAQGSA